ncbi:response regulator [Brevibacillus fluminis]|uniref:response regulator n=1 Tax=Brevibacillus fluminis TaxID=511487 RepID=UPI003F88A323
MIRAIIVDDEIPAIGNIADLLLASGKVEIVKEFTNPLEALGMIEQLDVDVAFLDIEMPGIDGLELAHRFIDLNCQVDVVFITAYNEFAVEAFELQALDYLLKPVTRERLQKTLERVAHRQISIKLPARHSILKVSCFGKFMVEDENGVPVKWRTNKTEELFAFLVDKSGQAVPKETIVDVLWGHMEEKRAFGNFNTCLYNMRKTLAQLGYPELLISHSGMFRLDMKRISSDAQKFERLVSRMGQMEEEMEETCYQEIVELICQYREGYLALNYYDWAGEKASQLEAAFPQLVMLAAAYDMEQGRPHKAVELLNMGLLLDPLHPELNRAMLQVYVQTQKRVAAMKHYAAYKDRLGRELGIKPDVELEQLIESLQA